MVLAISCPSIFFVEVPIIDLPCSPPTALLPSNLLVAMDLLLGWYMDCAPRLISISYNYDNVVGIKGNNYHWARFRGDLGGSYLRSQLMDFSLYDANLELE